jgi:hypothetical protein
VLGLEGNNSEILRESGMLDLKPAGPKCICDKQVVQ